MRRLAVLAASALLGACSDAAFATAKPGDDDSSVGPDTTIADAATDSATTSDALRDSSDPGEVGSDVVPVTDARPDTPNLCVDDSGVVLKTDRIYTVPNPVELEKPFTMYVVSTSALVGLTVNIGGSYCAGGGFTSTSAGPTCSEFNAAQRTIETSAAPFTGPGVYALEVYVNDADPPCTPPYSRKIVGSVTVVPASP